MAHEPVVMYDSPEAASVKTLTGWVSRTGNFWGEDEHMARYNGCTHRKCAECGTINEINSYCRTCRAAKDLAAYEAMPRESWDGTTPIFSEWLDKYFFNADELWDHLSDLLGEVDDEVDEEGLRLVHCRPQYLHQLDSDTWEDALRTEDDQLDLPDAVQAALDVLNQAIKAAGPVSWYPGDKAVLLPLTRPGTNPLPAVATEEQHA